MQLKQASKQPCERACTYPISNISQRPRGHEVISRDQL